MNQDQSELDKLIIDLKVLKQIPEYGKLSTQNDALTLDKGYMFQWLSRWWSNESRELTIKYIMNIPIWTGTSTFAAGQTPFGFYDYNTDLQCIFATSTQKIKK